MSQSYFCTDHMHKDADIYETDFPRHAACLRVELDDVWQSDWAGVEEIVLTRPFSSTGNF